MFADMLFADACNIFTLSILSAPSLTQTSMDSSNGLSPIVVPMKTPVLLFFKLFSGTLESFNAKDVADIAN